YPTGTGWGIGCDATNFHAIEKILQLKQGVDSKATLCVVGDLTMLNHSIETVPAVAYAIRTYAIEPATIIHHRALHGPAALIAEGKSLAIRVTKDEFCKKLIQKFRKPIVSTSANLAGENTPQSFKEIAPVILEGVDYIVNLQRDKKSGKPSAIIKLKNDGSVKVIRQ